jgi:hypothetical protein
MIIMIVDGVEEALRCGGVVHKFREFDVAVMYLGLSNAQER